MLFRLGSLAKAHYGYLAELLVLGLLAFAIYYAAVACSMFRPRLLSRFKLVLGLAPLGAGFTLALAPLAAALPPFPPAAYSPSGSSRAPPTSDSKLASFSGAKSSG